MNVTAATFQQEVLDSEQGVIVDYYADWCGPCHAIEPVVQKLAEKHGLKVVKVDIDTERGLAENAGAMSIPLIHFVKNGAVQATSVGALPFSALEKNLNLG